MGLLSAARDAVRTAGALAGAPAVWVRAETEASRLLTTTTAARSVRAQAQAHDPSVVLTAFARPGSAEAKEAERLISAATQGARLIDMPGIHTGQRFRVAGDLAGIPVGGSARLDEVTDTAVKLSVRGTFGGVGKELTLDMRRLDPTTAEFRVAGIGHGQPLLATIEDAGTAGLSIRAVGARQSLSVRDADGGYRLTLPLGGDDVGSILLTPAR